MCDETNVARKYVQVIKRPMDRSDERMFQSFDDKRRTRLDVAICLANAVIILSPKR